MTNPILALLKRPFKQRLNRKKLNKHCLSGIYESSFITLNGYKQFISIRGCDKKKPVILIIHGGPGSSYMPFSSWLLEWEKYFIVVQWDQAGSGKTFKLNGINQPISFESLKEDGLRLAEFILKYLNKEKIILLGSSMGSLVALKMLKEKPILLSSYIGTDQNCPNGIAEAYQIITENATVLNDKKSLVFLNSIGSDIRKWTRVEYDILMKIAIKTCKKSPNMIYDLMLPAILYDPEYTMKDIKIMDKGMKYAMENLYSEMMDFNFNTFGNHFEIPLYIFQGKYDCITPIKSAKKYLEAIIAPRKKIVEINNAGHLAMFCNPEQFLFELIKIF